MTAKDLSYKILDAIPLEHIYRYLEQKNASKKQLGGKGVGADAASRKVKDEAMKAMVHEIAK